MRRLIALVLIATLDVAHAAGRAWQGEYEYEAAFGETRGGSAMTAIYALRLSDERRGPACALEIAGFQIDERIVCTTREEGDALTVLFKSYASGDVRNAYGVQVYRPGQPLLRFERASRNGRPVLHTRWLGLTGLDGKRPTRDQTFARVFAKR